MPNLANLDRNAHQKLRVNDARALSVFRELNMCPVVPGEIARLVIEYPIAFAKNGDSGQFVCVAVFGLDVGQNLYFRDGTWTSFTVPLNVGRQPFYVGVAENPAGGAGAKNLITCIDLENPGVGEAEGEALFDESAAETTSVRAISPRKSLRSVSSTQSSSTSRYRAPSRARSAACIRSTRRSCARSMRRRSRT
jgi:hypothetical protein